MSVTVLDSGVQILGFHVLRGGVLDMRVRLLELGGLPAEVFGHADTIRPGRVQQLYRPSMWPMRTCCQYDTAHSCMLMRSV